MNRLIAFLRWAFCLVLILPLTYCSTTEQQVDELIEVLAANEIDSPEWQRAVDELALIGRPAARQLIALLGPDYYKGENYREFRDEIEQLRTGSARALGHIKPRAASALKAYITISYTDNERLASLWSLSEIGYEQATVVELEKQLADSTAHIRLHTAIALLKMNENGAKDEIITALQGEDSQLAQAALKGLAGANYFGVPLLAELAEQPGQHQSKVRQVLKDLNDQLVDQLSHEDPDLRLNSARALGLIAGGGGHDILIDLLDDPNNQVRFNAAAALARMERAEGIDFLFGALRAEDTILRTNAIKSLIEVQQNSAVVEKRLLAALQDDASLARAAAAQILGQARVGTAVVALLKTTEDPVAKVRWSAALALGHIAAPESKARLQSLLNDEDATVAYYAAWALRQLGNG